MCLADIYDVLPLSAPAPCAHCPSSVPRGVGADSTQQVATAAGRNHNPAERGSTPRPASIMRDRREGLRLALTGGTRILREAMEAPTNRERTARWRNRYALVPPELTLGDHA